MTKKIILSATILFFLSAILLAMLPTTYGAGQKACLAANLVRNKAYTFTHPLPPADFSGNGNQGYIGEGAGAERVPVLMYHYIAPSAYIADPDNPSIIDLETFEQGMNYLYDEGYYTASLSELEDYVHGKIRLPEKTVVITFDDGYENNYVYAYPILKKYGFRAAVFLIGKYVQEESSEEFRPDKRSYLTKKQIETSGDIFEFHSHTYNLHYTKPEKCGKVYAATRDIQMLKEDIANIKRFGIDTPYFAYPFGDFNHRIAYQLTSAGYRMAFTVVPGFVKPGDHPMFLKRLNVTTDTNLPALLDGMDG
jgi:peptidoglycan/xylan/chitin deacetylase (PgdA/CDA1 family)